MSAQFPLLIIIIDYLLGVIMWTLVGRFGMSIFMHENSDFFFMRVFVKYTDPVIRLFKPVTPKFLLAKLHPLYGGWFFYMTRFYIIPLILDIALWVSYHSHLNQISRLAFMNLAKFYLPKMNSQASS